MPQIVLQRLFRDPTALRVLAPNLLSARPNSLPSTAQQTARVFTDKWHEFRYGCVDYQRLVANQKAWYLTLYGFADEAELACHLRGCRIVLDAGCGLGYKAAWFSELSPESLVVAVDIADAIAEAADWYRERDNLLFVQADIGALDICEDGCFDYISCDQVIHHTTDPEATFRELVRLVAVGRDLAVYVYRRKALPRELVDDYFRSASVRLDHAQLMALAQQITLLGRTLSSLEGEIDFPAIPALGIEGGRMTVQRFIYWNFLKCYWNAQQGEHNSVMTNYDWYAPAQAARYTEEELRAWIDAAGLTEVHFHREPACYSGRFRRLTVPD